MRGWICCLLLVPFSPSVQAAVAGHGDDLRIARPEILRGVPILYLSAEEDRINTPEVSEPAAAFLGVRDTMIGADWGLPGHGHMMLIEDGNQAIAERIGAWLEAGPTAGR